jgi:hypothetical protein
MMTLVACFFTAFTTYAQNLEFNETPHARDPEQIVKNIASIENELYVIAQLKGEKPKDLEFYFKSLSQLERDLYWGGASFAIVIGGGFIAMYTTPIGLIVMFAGVSAPTVQLTDIYEKYEHQANWQSRIVRWYELSSPSDINNRIKKLNAEKSELIQHLKKSSVPVLEIQQP